MEHGLSLVSTDNQLLVKGIDHKTGDYQILYSGTLSEIEAFIHGVQYMLNKVEKITTECKSGRTRGAENNLKVLRHT
jgi:hypothetical protein